MAQRTIDILLNLTTQSDSNAKLLKEFKKLEEEAAKLQKLIDAALPDKPVKKYVDELEKAMTEMKSMFAEMKPKEEVVDKKAAEIATEKDVEMELPKLDGAPIDTINKFSQDNYNSFGKKTDNPQGSVLSKMYR